MLPTGPEAAQIPAMLPVGFRSILRRTNPGRAAGQERARGREERTGSPVCGFPGRSAGCPGSAHMTVTTSTECLPSWSASSHHSSAVLESRASSQASTASKGCSGPAASLSIA